MDAVGIAAGCEKGDKTSFGTVFASGSQFFFTEKMSKNLEDNEPA
jgi:hypothetical protein